MNSTQCTWATARRVMFGGLRGWHAGAMLLVAASALSATGCTVLPSSEIWSEKSEHSGGEAGMNFRASSVGRPGDAREDLLYYRVGVRLKAVRAFQLVFPDGYRARSDALTAELLKSHLGEIQVSESGQKWVSGNSPLRFSLDQSGNVDFLDIEVCGSRAFNLLATADGLRSFDFPMTRHDLETLFGVGVQLPVQEQFVPIQPFHSRAYHRCLAPLLGGEDS